MRVLVTGGCGFVGATVAIHLAGLGYRVTALDSLMRAGSELNLPRLRAAGVAVQRGDIRQPGDVAAAGAFDALVDAAAEPSVHAGTAGSPDHLLGTNVTGTLVSLEAARAQGAAVIFLSSSRIYPIPGLADLPLVEGTTRLDLPAAAAGPGWSREGIAEDFPLSGRRSLYGATKLAAETLVVEYGHAFGLPVVVNRCGVLAGPWQMGRTDQGFVALWAARHLYGGTLAYRGFGGTGKQVRDVLHAQDLAELVAAQLARPERVAGGTYNIGGGRGNSVSLAELTELCRARAGGGGGLGSQPATDAVDVPWYIADNVAITAATGWTPQRGLATLLDDVFAWLARDRASLAGWL